MSTLSPEKKKKKPQMIVPREEDPGDFKVAQNYLSVILTLVLPGLGFLPRYCLNQFVIVIFI